ncbi:MAG: penicillin-binding protein 2 [bacterium]|nr:penicillin-binding protein 2 [bacterium]
MGTRVAALIWIFSLAFALLGYRFFDVQVSQGDYYGAQASSINTIGGYLVPKRGSIYFSDKNGGQIPAAFNKEYPLVYAVPKEIKDPVSAAAVLNPTVEDMTLSELEAVLGKKSDPYEPLIKRPSDAQVRAIEEAALEGIYVDSGLERFYPFGSSGAHVLGFVSANELFWLGQYGAENYYNQLLGGIPGEAEGDRVKRPVHGKDIQLTIDANIQTHAEEVLTNLVQTYRGEAGTVIVAEPDTGKILAMASYPSFDPNNYGQFDVGTFLNPAVQSVYEPGSIFKVITMASAIDAGKVTPDTTYYDSGELTLNAHTIRNWDLKANGTITMTNVIERSVNTGAAFAERQLGNDNFYAYLKKFGFADETQIDMPGEVTGSLLPLEQDVRDINFATASFGQGISMTPIRLLSAISAIANGGELMRPYVNVENRPQKVRKVISKESSRQVIDMMVSAVDKAQIARINGYSVAGKTGTAQVPGVGGRAYTDEVINTYVGFAPAYDPRFIILIRLDKPYGAPLAGLTVVPAFRELAQFVINYYNIPPDRIDIE